MGTGKRICIYTIEEQGQEVEAEGLLPEVSICLGATNHPLLIITPRSPQVSEGGGLKVCTTSTKTHGQNLDMVGSEIVVQLYSYPWFLPTSWGSPAMQCICPRLDYKVS